MAANCGIARGITDRAKRYRANRCKKKAKFCETCGSRQNLLIGHRDGNESNNRPYNLGTFCKSCNGIDAVADKKAGRGVRTRQYNPGATNLAQYVQAAMDHVRGSHDAGGKVLHETPKAIRQQFAKEIWWRRGYRGNPPADIMPEFWAGKLKDSHGHVVTSEKQARAILLSELRALGEIPARKNGKRKNPDETPADALYRKFHGYKPDNKLVFKVPEIDPYGSHPELAQFGLLVRLVVGEGIEISPSSNRDEEKIVAVEDYFWSTELLFLPSVAEYDRLEQSVRTQGDVDRLKSYMRKNGTPDVAGVPDSAQIYIVGGNQNIDSKLGEIGADPQKEIIDCGFCYLIEYYTQKRFDRGLPTDYFHKFGEKSGVPPRLIYWRSAKLLQLVGGEYFITARGIHN